MPDAPEEGWYHYSDEDSDLEDADYAAFTPNKTRQIGGTYLKMLCCVRSTEASIPAVCFNKAHNTSPRVLPLSHASERIADILERELEG